MPRDPDALRARLGDRRLALWAEGHVLHVAYRGPAENPQVVGVDVQLSRVDGDLWAGQMTIERLDEAVFQIFEPTERGELITRDHVHVWRGPLAPPELPYVHVVPADHRLPFLGGERGVHVYRPAGIDGPLPAVCMADGEALQGFAGLVESMIRARDLPPVILVGVESGDNDERAREYLPLDDPERFTAHLGFVVDQVIPWARDTVQASGVWLAAGFSNGAVWALNAAQRRPDVFRGVVALSPGIPPELCAPQTASAPHYIAAGTQERGFRRAAAKWAKTLDERGAAVQHREWIGGHDEYWWRQHLPAGLRFVLKAESGSPSPAP
ncbi:hypothetical protein J5X84_22585 [Streptosporangiaceae bacterium NEAU-GS5]|nr:hypothetical protein [Streptosporangiaceae bacterium NEAU-GS5]